MQSQSTRTRETTCSVSKCRTLEVDKSGREEEEEEEEATRRVKCDGFCLHLSASWCAATKRQVFHTLPPPRHTEPDPLGPYLLSLRTKRAFKALVVVVSMDGRLPVSLHVNVPVGAPRSADMTAPEAGDGDPAQRWLLNPGTALQIRPAQSTLKSLLRKYF